MWQPKWNGNQTVLAAAIHISDKDAGPLKGTAAGSCSLGIVEHPRVRAAVQCGEMDQGDVREKIVVGNTGGAKSGSHGS